MKKRIKKIEIIGILKDRLNSNHDVVVELDDGRKYTATFFTLRNIQYLMSFYKEHSGECNRGSFFWAADMCIIELIDEDLIKESANSMIEEGVFEKVFKQISD